MKCLIIFAIIFAAVAAAADEAKEIKEKVDITVYYESLCPDSRKFFTNQLTPTLNTTLKDYVNITLIPFGKSTHAITNGQHSFTCDHGADECDGNKVHACAIKLIDGGKRTMGYGYNMMTLAYINCLMAKVDRDAKPFKMPTEQCAVETPGIELSKIENCAVHPDGSSYLANYGTITESFGKLDSVPTIVFNKKYVAKNSSEAQKNLIKVICEHLSMEKKPEVCTTNGVTGLSAGIILLVVAIGINKLF